jgi:PAS domain S-box-containing protein
LAAIIVIGPRIGRFGKNTVPIHGHDLPMVTLGVFLLWFGWFGFNGGSTLGLTPEVPTIIVNTTVSGAFGGLVAMALAWRLGGRPDVTMIMNGSLAGLVGITASAHIMTPLAAAGIGSIAAVAMYAVAMLLERLEIDDVVGAVPVHLAAGIWGTLAVAIFADPASWGTGLGRWEQLGVQATGVGAGFAWAFGVGFSLMWLINRWLPLRIDPEGERVGLNVSEHGASTEILDLLTEMDDQRRAGDFSQPVSVEPHTEIGQIAQQYNRVLADINAEQRRREAITEALRRQTTSLQLLREAAAAANRAKSVEDAIRTCLESICTFGGWTIGHCYMIDDATGERISTKIWHLDDAERYAVFRDATESKDFEFDAGLPGRVVTGGEPAWIVDVTKDEDFARAKPAEDIGIKGGAAFPVLVGEDVVAVLEFFSHEPMDLDEAMLEVMASVGTQLGRVVERGRSEAARFKSVVDNMPAHVFLRDRDGRFILINRQYEEFYGVTNDFVRGKTLHEVEQAAGFGLAPDKNAAIDAQVIEEDRVVELEFDVTHHGELHTVSDVKFPIRDHSGEIIAVGGVELDITARKQAERALRESEERYEAITSNVPGVVYERVMQPDGTISYPYLSPGLTDIYGLDPEAVMADPSLLLDTLHPDDRDGFFDSLKASAEALADWLHEFRIVAGDGTVKWMRGGSRIHKDENDNLVWHGILLDISEEKRAQEALAEKEAQLRLALDNMPGGIVFIDRDRNFVLYNPQYSALHDYPDGLLKVGGSLLDELRFQVQRGDYGPDDPDKLIEKVNALFDRTEPLSYERTLPNGRTLQFSSAPMPAGGYVTIATDITERKRAEEDIAAKEAQLRVALDNMPGGIMLVDNDWNYLFFNSRYCELHDFPEGLLKVGDSMRVEDSYQAERGDFGPGDKDDLIEELFALYPRDEAVSYEREVAGSGRTLHINAAPTPEGGYVTIVTDITEHKRAEEALIEAKLRAEEASEALQHAKDNAMRATQAKSQFLANMSHELRTPMNAIMGFTRLVMRRSKDELAPKQFDNLGKILISAENLLALINDILDLSKIEAGEVTIHPTEFAMEPLIDDGLATVENLVKSRKVRLLSEVEADLPMLYTDRDKVRQILINLLGNAVKFTEQGTVTVRARRREGEMVVLEVSDTGIGIPGDSLDLIFGQFSQVDASSTRQHGGTGLGLAITRHLSQLLGGDIAVESSVGEGSTFTVTILERYVATDAAKPKEDDAPQAMGEVGG